MDKRKKGLFSLRTLYHYRFIGCDSFGQRSFRVAHVFRWKNGIAASFQRDCNAKIVTSPQPIFSSQSFRKRLDVWTGFTRRSSYAALSLTTEDFGIEVLTAMGSSYL